MKQKKKILFVSTKSVWGGAQKYIYDLAANLPKEIFDVAVAAGGKGPLKKKIEDAGIPYIEIQNFERDVKIMKEIFAFFELIRLFRKLKPDIVHLNGSKAGAIGTLAAKAAFVPKIVFSTHGLPYFEKRPRWQNFFIYITLKFAAYFQNIMIAISQFDYEHALKHNLVLSSKLAYIPISIEPEKYRFLSRQEARVKLGKTDSIVIGTIAEFTKNKDIANLIDAIGYLNTPIEGGSAVRLSSPSKLFSGKCIIIGWGEEREMLQKKIKTLKLENTISLIAGSGEDYKYLKALDIFVLSSLKEGLPYTLLEASIAEVPIVATAVGGVPEIVEHEKTGLLVNASSPEELASAIHVLAENREYAKKLAASAREKVMRDHQLSSMLQKTIEVYRV